MALYRVIDGLGDDNKEDKDKLESIEMKTFNLIKKDVVKDGVWTGDREQNRDADLRVAKLIRNSLYLYERTRKSYMPSYFKFNK